MHRSGTSWLAKTLERGGVCLGDTTGYYENARFTTINEMLLKHEGATWDNPHYTGFYQMGCSVVEFKTELCRGMNGNIIGFKDPRLCFTYPFWRHIFDYPLLVATVRHPMAVAQSLHRRDRIDIEEGLDLWRRYNTELLKHHPLLVAFPEMSGLKKIIDDLGLRRMYIETYRPNQDMLHWDGTRAPDEYEDFYNIILASIGDNDNGKAYT